jgi:isoquinoline 1-oxidoreductase subunit beta
MSASQDGTPTGISRRSLIKAAASGAILAVGIDFSRGVVLAQEKAAAPDLIGPTLFKTWVEIGRDNVTTFYSPDVEYGQGTLTAQAMLVAEEMDCDWAKIRVVQSGTDQVYANPNSHQVSTNSSAALRYRFDQLRRIGATAREMLKAAAAAQWNVPIGELTTSNSVVTHAASQRSASYGSLSVAAAKLSVPKDLALRPASQWRLIGKPTPRLDIVQKSTGQARYAVDLRMRGLLFAAVERAPIRGSNVVSFDDKKARARKGVKSVENLGYGVAVVATDAWTARRALQDVAVVWEKSRWDQTSSETLAKSYEEGLNQSGTVAKNDGDVEAAGKVSGAKIVEVEYTSQFLHHMCMEPMSSTAWVHDGMCEVWSPTNGASNLLNGIAFLLDLPPEKVIVRRSEFIGGSFGRRDRIDQDIEAVQLSQRMKAPVQVLQRREHDTKTGFFRPYQKTRVKAVLDASGKLIGWTQKIAVQSMAHANHDLSELKYTGYDIKKLVPFLKAEGSPFYNMPFDFFSTSQTAYNFAYAIPNVRVEVVAMESPLAITYWRSVGQSNNTWEMESLMDELAFAAGADPIAYRKSMMEKHPRGKVVLDELARRIGWSGAPKVGTGSGWGIALSIGFAAYVGMAVQLEASGKKLTIKRVVAVVDQGITINPEQAEAQVQGGVVDGLASAIFQQITLRDGKVEQNSWYDYPTFTIKNMPPVDVHFQDSGVTPLGSITESATPLVMPAFLNALYIATGDRIRELPLAKHGYEI